MESPAVRFSFRVRRPQNGLGRHRASMPNACADWTRAASLENIDAEDDGDILEPVDRCNRHKAKSLTPSPVGARRRRKMSFDATCFNLMETSPEMFAEELTNIDLPLFQAIPREELLACKWTSKQKTHVSPHIVAFTNQFNQTSFWVMKEIINRSLRKARTDCLSYFIRLAKKLLNLNNINSLVAVVSALQSASIYRLKRTWADVSKKDKTTYCQLQTLLSEDENKRNLRQHMQQMKQPCIPYLGVFLTDLTYLLAAAEKASDDSAAQVFREQMMSTADQVAKWQMSAYAGLSELQPVRQYLQSSQYLYEFTKFLEDDLFRASLQVEPEVSLCPSRSPSPRRRMTLASSTSGNNMLSREWRGSAQSPTPHATATTPTTAAACPPYASKSFSGTLNDRSSTGPVSVDAIAPKQKPGSYSSHATQKILGHRRAHSYDQNLLRGIQAPLSVIGTEALPGPRHLIDDSLLAGTSAGTTKSSSSLCSDLDLPSPVDPVLGLHVCALDSESGAESEGLLDDGHQSEGAEDIPKIHIDVDLLDATMTGMLKRKSNRKGSIRRVCRWRSMFVAVCGSMLAFYLKPPNRKKGRAEPHDVINLTECEVSLNVVRDKPNRFQLMHTVTHKIYTLKAASPEEASAWLSHIHEAMGHKKKTTPVFLMTFEEDDQRTYD